MYLPDADDTILHYMRKFYTYEVLLLDIVVLICSLLVWPAIYIMAGYVPAYIARLQIYGLRLYGVTVRDRR